MGDPNNSFEDCNQPNGYVANADDECPNDELNACLITSINFHSGESKRLFPNPTNGIIKISKNSTWKLVNINGTILSSGEGDIIDLTNISSGVYIIIIGIEHYKVIKN